jgi:hypothetical protein
MDDIKKIDLENYLAHFKNVEQTANYLQSRKTNKKLHNFRICFTLMPFRTYLEMTRSCLKLIAVVQGPMFSTFMDVFRDFLVHKDCIYICGLSLNLLMRLLSPVNYGKSSWLVKFAPAIQIFIQLIRGSCYLKLLLNLIWQFVFNKNHLFDALN